MPTIARRIADWVAALKFEDLPAKTVHEAKRRILDSIGTALGAYRSRPAQVARAAAMSVSDNRAGIVWGTKHSTTPDLAAFANGTMVRYLDYNDTYLSLEPAHPSDNIAPAVAVTQAQGRSGQDCILAIVIGYEIQCRLCDAASLRAGGWDHVTYGALSTAALAGKLWDLDAEHLEHALGLAGVCNITTRQTRTGQISDWKACAFANAARNGVFAANLARRGLTGPFEIFEGPKGLIKQLNLKGLGERLVLGKSGDFMIDRTYIKYWPAEYHSQSAIDACLQLRPQIASRKIEKIHMGSFEAAVSIIGSEPEKLRPTSRETADHSMFYCCAAALVDGDVTLATFDDERLTDSRLLDLVDRTTIVEDPALNAGYPKGIPNDITITLADGAKLRKRVDFPRGHAENPMTDEEVVAKFQRLADGVVTRSTADRLVEQVMAFDKLKDTAALFQFEVK
jgi:2-methylcitrate dehydratase